jgi:putative FmdB family regulatory protein
MPTYQYACSECESVFETFATIAEDSNDPQTHCPKCDPEVEKEGTLYKYMGNCRPSFNLKPGCGGYHRSGWN